MKTINISVGLNGEAKASDNLLGMTGEHNSTVLKISAPTGFFEGAEYMRICFGAFETEKLYADDDGIIEYAVPSAATDSTLKSWQLCCYAAEDGKTVLIRKSEVVLFSLNQSVYPMAELDREATGSIENEIAGLISLAEKAQADIQYMDNQLQAADGEFVHCEEGKGLSSNDFTDEYVEKIGADSEKIFALEGRVSRVEDRPYRIIETATLSENLTSFIRTKEPDGTPYSFERIKAVLNIPPYSGNISTDLGFRIYNGMNTLLSYPWITGAILPTKSRRLEVEFYKKCGEWCVDYVLENAAYSGSVALNSITIDNNSEKYPAINKLSAIISTSIQLPAGTVITIKGVDYIEK